MSDKHPAEVLADECELGAWSPNIVQNEVGVRRNAAAMLRRIPALEAERLCLLSACDGWKETVRRQSVILAEAQDERDKLRADHEMEMAGAKDVIGRLEQFLAMAEAERDKLRAEVELLKQTLRLARGAVLAEREACAQIVASNADACVEWVSRTILEANAAAIRARGAAAIGKGE